MTLTLSSGLDHNALRIASFIDVHIIVGSFLERHGVRLQIPLRGRSSEIPWHEVNSIKTVVLHWYLQKVLST